MNISAFLNFKINGSWDFKKICEWNGGVTIHEKNFKKIGSGYPLNMINYDYN